MFSILMILFVLTMAPAWSHVISSDVESDHGLTGLEFNLAMLKKTARLRNEISQMLNEQLSNVKNQLGDINDEVDILESIEEQLQTTAKTTTSVATTSPVPIVLKCPDGWLTYKDSCYYFDSNTLVFPEAKTLCTKLGGHLVHPDSREENTFLKNFMLTYLKELSYWIGITDKETEGVWKMVGENTTVPFTDWNGNEPQNFRSIDPEGENCAVFTSSGAYRWADVPCSDSNHKSRAVCEKHLGLQN